MEGRRSWTGSKSSWGNIRTADAPRTVGIQHLFRCNGGSFDGRVLDFEDCSGCLGIQRHGQLGLCGGVVVIAHISWQFTVFSSAAQNGWNERVLFTRFRHRFGGGKCASVPLGWSTLHLDKPEDRRCTATHRISPCDLERPRHFPFLVTSPKFGDAISSG